MLASFYAETDRLLLDVPTEEHVLITTLEARKIKWIVFKKLLTSFWQLRGLFISWGWKMHHLFRVLLSTLAPN